MGSMTVVEIARQAELLAPEDQLYLIARLADKARHTYRQTPPRCKGHDICAIEVQIKIRDFGLCPTGQDWREMPCS